MPGMCLFTEEGMCLFVLFVSPDFFYSSSLFTIVSEKAYYK